MSKQEKQSTQSGLKWDQKKADQKFADGKYLYVNPHAKAAGTRSGTLKAMKGQFDKDAKEGYHDENRTVYVPLFNITGALVDVVDALYLSLGATDAKIADIYHKNEDADDMWLLEQLKAGDVIDFSNVDEGWVADVAADYKANYDAKKLEHAEANKYSWVLDDILDIAKNISKATVIVTEKKKAAPKKKGAKSPGRGGRRKNLVDRLAETIAKGKALKIGNFAAKGTATMSDIPKDVKSSKYRFLNNLSIMVQEKADLDAFLKKYAEDAEAKGENADDFVEDVKAEFGAASKLAASPGRRITRRRASGGRAPRGSTGRATRASGSRASAGRASGARQSTERVTRPAGRTRPAGGAAATRRTAAGATRVSTERASGGRASAGRPQAGATRVSAERASGGRASGARVAGRPSAGRRVTGAAVRPATRHRRVASEEKEDEVEQL